MTVLQKDPPPTGTDYAKYIEETLEEAHTRATKSTPEYWAGYYDGLSDERDERRREKMDKAAESAYIYAGQLLILLNKAMGVTTGDVVQCRYGLDSTINTPTVLMVLPESLGEKFGEIMALAAAFEVYIYHNPCGGVRNCGFWVLPDGFLDKQVIEDDFPCYRSFNDGDA